MNLIRPETNFGKSEGNDWEKYIGFQTAFNKRNFKFSSGYSNRIKGIPTGAFNTDLTRDVESTDKRFFVETSYRKATLKRTVLCFSDYITMNTITPAPILPMDMIHLMHQQADGQVEKFNIILKQEKETSLQQDLNTNMYSTTHDYKEWDNDTTYFNQNVPFSFFSLYAQDQIKLLKNLNLTAGLRYDQYSVFGHSTKSSTCSGLQIFRIFFCEVTVQRSIQDP